jgi:hypothetical protein
VKTIRLTFPKSVDKDGDGMVGDPEHMQIFVGACDSKQSGSGSVSFDIAAPSSSNYTQYFSVDTSKGSCKAGEPTAVTFTFDPPDVASGGNGLVVVGQWAEVTYRVVLKGGFVLSGDAPDAAYDVVLRGFVVV